jgi:hypothetical protein
MNDVGFRTDKIEGLNSESQGAGLFIIDRHLSSRLNPFHFETSLTCILNVNNNSCNSRKMTEGEYPKGMR